MDVHEAIAKRRSVRSYESDPVPVPVLDRIIAAAGKAPSPYNAQPWHFHVTTGAVRDAVCEITALSTVHLQEYLAILPPDRLEAAERFFASLGNSPVVIVVSTPTADDGLPRINTYLATGCALQNLMLAACEEGLSCCNLTFAFWVRDRLADLLGIGEDREIVSLVLLGYPAEIPVDPGRRSDIVTYVD
jgi:nitroreductase